MLNILTTAQSQFFLLSNVFLIKFSQATLSFASIVTRLKSNIILFTTTSYEHTFLFGFQFWAFSSVLVRKDITTFINFPPLCFSPTFLFCVYLLCFSPQFAGANYRASHGKEQFKIVSTFLSVCIGYILCFLFLVYDCVQRAGRNLTSVIMIPFCLSQQYNYKSVPS